MNRYEGKTVVVTGGASGIGLAIVRRLASEGGALHLLDLDAPAVSRATDDLRSAGWDVTGHVGDVTDETVMAALIGEITAKAGVDVLVNNAGIGHIGSAESTTPEDMERLWRVNVLGVWHGIKAALPGMKARHQGVILNMSSIAAKVGLEARFAYSVTKGAISAMTLQVARDYVAHGIRCNCLCPARVHTPFVDGYLARTYPGQEDAMFATLAAAQPMGRMGTPEEIAALTAFICGDEAGFVTGSAYDIDGGTVTLR
jgi:2-keto-3-deoxy-L-fuconate dehydrogenase